MSNTDHSGNPDETTEALPGAHTSGPDCWCKPTVEVVPASNADPQVAEPIHWDDLADQISTVKALETGLWRWQQSNLRALDRFTQARYLASFLLDVAVRCTSDTGAASAYNEGYKDARTHLGDLDWDTDPEGCGACSRLEEQCAFHRGADAGFIQAMQANGVTIAEPRDELKTAVHTAVRWERAAERADARTVRLREGITALLAEHVKRALVMEVGHEGSPWPCNCLKCGQPWPCHLTRARAQAEGVAAAVATFFADEAKCWCQPTEDQS